MTEIKILLDNDVTEKEMEDLLIYIKGSVLYRFLCTRTGEKWGRFEIEVTK